MPPPPSHSATTSITIPPPPPSPFCHRPTLVEAVPRRASLGRARPRHQQPAPYCSSAQPHVGAHVRVRGPPSCAAVPPWPHGRVPHSGEQPPDGHHPPGRAVETIRAFRTKFRRDARGIDSEFVFRRSDFACVFLKI
ncbi:formin-like protein 3 isoform X1 [Iris pallida]|uniref:Formin-like protein 3 isoform X1 n=1 Tax=Iris pallida TaxID=29817 RepID=A0AAX6H8K8_IRIPA|nr:formin-like protein 3 isoform X1 [Iris pallida]